MGPIMAQNPLFGGWTSIYIHLPTILMFTMGIGILTHSHTIQLKHAIFAACSVCTKCHSRSSLPALQKYCRFSWCKKMDFFKTRRIKERYWENDDQPLDWLTDYFWTKTVKTCQNQLFQRGMWQPLRPQKKSQYCNGPIAW
jgi:hypothetical protein